MRDGDVVVAKRVSVYEKDVKFLTNHFVTYICESASGRDAMVREVPLDFHARVW